MENNQNSPAHASDWKCVSLVKGEDMAKVLAEFEANGDVFVQVGRISREDVMRGPGPVANPTK